MYQLCASVCKLLLEAFLLGPWSRTHSQRGSVPGVRPPPWAREPRVSVRWMSHSTCSAGSGDGCQWLPNTLCFQQTPCLGSFLFVPSGCLVLQCGEGGARETSSQYGTISVGCSVCPPDPLSRSCPALLHWWAALLPGFWVVSGVGRLQQDAGGRRTTWASRLLPQGPSCHQADGCLSCPPGGDRVCLEAHSCGCSSFFWVPGSVLLPLQAEGTFTLPGCLP